MCLYLPRHGEEAAVEEEIEARQVLMRRVRVRLYWS